MANEQKDWKTRLAQILDKQRQRHENPEIASWVSKELHPAFNTLRKLLADERGIEKLTIKDITSSGETLKFEVNDVLNTARVWYAVNLSDSRQGVTGEVKFTVEYGYKVHSPKRSNINILAWDQSKIIDDFLTAFEKWEP